MSTASVLTAEAIWEMPVERLELVDGSVIGKWPMGVLTGQAAANLFSAFGNIAEQRDLGLVCPGGLGYVLCREPDLIRVPDVWFVAWDSVPDDYPPDRYWAGAPTLAVEIVSLNDLAEDLHARVQDYLEAGTRQVWMLWPRTRSVYRPDADMRELGPDATLDGGDVLPGFTVKVGELFDIPRPQ